MIRSFFLALACGAAAAHAQAPELSLPIDCVPGETCWIVNYVDTDAGEGARDYTCGSQTYDGHKGTDFAVRHAAAMGQGVTVLASAPGVVKARRDGVADRRPGEALPPKPSSTACGNGVVIDHGEGWETQYCHLRIGSVRVRKGERVERGAPLGLAGRSGHAAFPHVHFELRRAGAAIDPFTGGGKAAACGGPKETAWNGRTAQALGYRPAAIFDAGIAGAAVTPAAAWGEEDAAPARRDSPALFAWAAVFGVRKGDELRVSLIGDAGEVLAHRRYVAERAQARTFFYTRRKLKSELWPAGDYRVEAELVRAPDIRIERSAAARLR